MRAAWEPRTVPVQTGRGNTLIALERGQFIFGRNTAAEALRCPASSVYGRLQTLQKLEMIDTQPGTHFSIITIRNYEHYQPDAFDNRHPSRQASGTQPAPIRHKEELKHLRKDLTPSSAAAERLPLLLDGEEARQAKGEGVPKEKPHAKGAREDDDMFRAIVEDLNRATGSTFRITSEATRRHVRARLAEGFTLDDFRTVIATKVKDWRDDPGMRRFLRPETLFGTKFEGYLQAAKLSTGSKLSGNRTQVGTATIPRDFLDRPIYDSDTGEEIDYQATDAEGRKVRGHDGRRIVYAVHGEAKEATA